MAMNGHKPLAKQDSKSTAIVQVNSLSEDDQHINPADHDGIKLNISIFILIYSFN
jgi:hypothetical protein